MKYKKIRSKQCIFISFFLSFIITLIFIATGVLLGGLNQNVIMNGLKKTNYYQKSYDSFIEQAETIADSYGQTKEVIAENISIGSYHIKANNYFKNELKQADMSGIKVAIDMELDNIIRQWNTSKKETFGNVTVQESETIEQCADEIADVYYKSIEFPFVGDIASYREGFISFLKLALPAGLLAITVLVITLFVSNTYKHRALRYIVHAITGSNITLFVVGLYLLRIKDQVIQTENARYQAFLNVYYRDSIVPFFIILCVGILFAATLHIAVRQMRNGLIAKNKND